jgi:hypothetical protein
MKDVSMEEGELEKGSVDEKELEIVEKMDTSEKVCILCPT